MTVAEVLGQLKHFTNAQRLELIEAATRLIRAELQGQARQEQDERLRRAALSLKELYEPGGELTEWNALDGEDVLDDYLPR
jgi:hypothetical protein